MVGQRPTIGPLIHPIRPILPAPEFGRKGGVNYCGGIFYRPHISMILSFFQIFSDFTIPPQNDIFRFFRFSRFQPNLTILRFITIRIFCDLSDLSQIAQFDDFTICHKSHNRTNFTNLKDPTKSSNRTNIKIPKYLTIMRIAKLAAVRTRLPQIIA